MDRRCPFWLERSWLPRCKVTDVKKTLDFLRSCSNYIDYTTKRCIIISNEQSYLLIGRICCNERTRKSQDWPIYCMAAGTSWKDSGSRASLRPRITETPLRRATQARHKGVLFYRVRTISFFGFYGNDIFCCCHIAHGRCLLARLAWTRSKRHSHTTSNTRAYLTSSRLGSSALHAALSS